MEYMKAEARFALGVLSPICVTDFCDGKVCGCAWPLILSVRSISFLSLGVDQRNDFVTLRAHMELASVRLRFA
jgi:hypothetical protein